MIQRFKNLKFNNSKIEIMESWNRGILESLNYLI